ncbi:carboxylesterase [Aspergillus heteromorphus CBS 117.55]|uniref:Carboxylic ester hydrolase n=1 Tax=Aspergillus heteromorphus CBS 117.55 TaxID=1448321 RepID=A0A317WZB3_9EURO|nr:carboxylesterase [Aspergillus heteromorphus CBS 117.55]PWY90672.1 carboxylesterase [Aspergillus heteromorphus CBS 117.55]
MWGRTIFAALALLSGCVPAEASLTILFQNDGNWTTHAQTPSALFVDDALSYQAAQATCAHYNETLLSCKDYADFHYSFTYQQHLQNISPDQLFWSSCSSDRPTTWDGEVSSTSSSASLPFLCSNSAPFVEEVATDYSVFPRVNASANGVTFEGLRDHMAFRFMGIPFAQPPVGDLRFKYAQEWTGSYVNATKYGPACMQTGWYDGNSYGLNPWGNSEDCLHLNVYTPSLPSSGSSRRPVMLWIHGGGQAQGTGADSTFDGDSFVSRNDVVLVTINYRLNIFGYLSLDDDVVPGNCQLTDKIEALKWVQKYITAFGGDPENVTVFGQSAGASSVIDLLTTPKANGLFQNAIAQSIAGHVETSNASAAAILPSIQPLCNSTGTERLRCLQSLSAETLLNISSVATWDTVIDGIYILDYPVAQVAKAVINKVNFLTGYMPEEAQSILQTTISPNATSFNASLQTLVGTDSITEAQVQAIFSSQLWAKYDSPYNATVHVDSPAGMTCYSKEFAEAGAASHAYKSLYVYLHQRAYGLNYYDWYDLCTYPVGEPDTPYYRCHSGDLYEVFGTYYLFDQPVRSNEDIYYTNMVQDMWASFARSGNPNVESSYLRARGYSSTLQLTSRWNWVEYTPNSAKVANLQYPQPSLSTLPYLEECTVLGLDHTN